jgi:vanillate O-demethylase ferredoxin subunit
MADGPGQPTAKLSLAVRAVRTEAQRIKTFELIDRAGRELPAFTAGAHLDVEVPGGFVRQYSLCNSPSDRRRYEIAVLDVEDGRGGSRAMHTQVRGDDTLWVSPPRNDFPLREDARRHLLVAGGIGITPIMSMLERLNSIQACYAVVYCTRSPQQTAFTDRLSRVAAGRLTLHHDYGDPERSLDIHALLATWEPDTHLYYCGPSGMMAAAAAAAAHWPPESVHSEYFTAAPPPAAQAGSDLPDGAFEVELARRGVVLTVTADKTIVETLRDAGIEHETSCEAGVCATCRTRYLAGTPDHRDVILDDAERGEYLTICCSRSATARLVLDL